MHATKEEVAHAKLQGARFDDALAKATFSVRSCGAFIGLDKLRETIAWRAALAATGFKVAVVLPPGLWTVETAPIATRAFDDAVKAAQS